MGSKKTRLAHFLSDHPVCCYCAGRNPATTEDHWPSRSIFDQRKWPEGYVFPACGVCNSETAANEALFALLCRASPKQANEESCEQTRKLWQSVAEKMPDVFASFFVVSANEKRNWLRKTGNQLRPGESTGDIPIISLEHPEIHKRVKPCAAKLFMSLHYKHTGKVLGPDGGIVFRWYSNTNTCDEVPIDLLTPFLNGTPELVRQNKKLNDQFSYSFGAHATDNAVSVFWVTFNVGIGMIGIVFNDQRTLKVDIPTDQILRPFNRLPAG